MEAIDNRYKAQLIRSAFLTVFLCSLFIVFSCVGNISYASDDGLPDGYDPPVYNGIPAQQFKNVFEDETVIVEGIEVKRDRYNLGDPSAITFRIFNSTTQETERMVTTETDDDGYTLYLPAMQLKKNHNYIFFCEDTYYQRGTSVYVHIMDSDNRYASDGAGAYDYKIYDEQLDTYGFEKLTSITVFKRSEPETDPYGYNRFSIRDGSEVKGIPLLYSGQPVPGIKLRLVSELETIETTSASDGRIYADLIEDITYMAYADNDAYYVDSFPIVCKDTTAYNEGRYCYDHSTCSRVDEIELIKTGDPPPDDFHRKEKITSLRGNVTLTGMAFRHLLLIDRRIDRSEIPYTGSSQYEVVGITAVNPHRWEICKLLGTEFRYSLKTGEDKIVDRVSYLKDGKLHELSFSRSGEDSIEFAMNSVSLYPVVIEYSNIIAADPVITLSGKKFEYNGKNIRPGVTVKVNGAALSADSYTVSYPKSSKKPGEYKVQVVLKGKYKGSGSAKYTVVPEKTKIVKLTSGKRYMTVRWKKQSVQTSGYQIQYSTSKSFSKGNKTVTVKKNKTTKKTIKKLKSKKTYYVRVRTYKLVGKKKYCSAWSKPKHIKVR